MFLNGKGSEKFAFLRLNLFFEAFQIVAKLNNRSHHGEGEV